MSKRSVIVLFLLLITGALTVLYLQNPIPLTGETSSGEIPKTTYRLSSDLGKMGP